MRLPATLRWFWRIYIPVAVAAMLAVLAMPFGPAIEARFDPPRINNANLNPTRSLRRICWVWSSDKLRLPYSDDVDVHLDVLDETGAIRNTFVPPLHNALTELPWQSGLPIGVGHHEIPYCIDLPRVTLPTDRLRVRFTPIVHGWFNLWPVPIWTPDIVDPPWAQAPL